MSICLDGAKKDTTTPSIYPNTTPLKSHHAITIAYILQFMRNSRILGVLCIGPISLIKWNVNLSLKLILSCLTTPGTTNNTLWHFGVLFNKPAFSEEVFFVIFYFMLFFTLLCLCLWEIHKKGYVIWQTTRWYNIWVWLQVILL